MTPNYVSVGSGISLHKPMLVLHVTTGSPRMQRGLPEPALSSSEEKMEALAKNQENKTKYDVRNQVKQQVEEGLVSEHDIAKESAMGVALKMSEWRQGIAPVSSRPETAAASLDAAIKSLAKRITRRQQESQMVATVIAELTPKYEALGTFEVDRLIRKEVAARMAPQQAKRIAKEKAAKVEQIRKDADVVLQARLFNVSRQYPNISQPEMEFRIKREIVHDANIATAGLEHQANSDEDPSQTAVRQKVKSELFKEIEPAVETAAREIVRRKVTKLMAREVSETVAARLPAVVKKHYQAVAATVMSEVAPRDLKAWVENHRKEQYGENACMPPFCDAVDKLDPEVKVSGLQIVPTPPTTAPTLTPTSAPTGAPT